MYSGSEQINYSPPNEEEGLAFSSLKQTAERRWSGLSSLNSYGYVSGGLPDTPCRPASVITTASSNSFSSGDSSYSSGRCSVTKMKPLNLLKG